MKNAGILLLSVGVAISAGFGARLSPTMRAQSVTRGEAQLRREAAEAAKAEYCEALVGQLGARAARVRQVAGEDGCELPSSGEADAAGEGARAPSVDVQAICAGRGEAGGTVEEMAASAREALEARRGVDVGDLGPEVARLREAWVAALDAEILPAARAAVLDPPAPAQRLRAWFEDSGTFFLLGLVLVVAGAVMGRVAQRREAGSEPGDGGGGEARDLGELLRSLHEEVAGLEARCRGDAPLEGEDLRAFKERLSALQLERIDPIVATAARVQARYGMRVFAEIFGPLSSAERNLNRAWSALVDQHRPEAASSLARAGEELSSAEAALARASEA